MPQTRLRCRSSMARRDAFALALVVLTASCAPAGSPAAGPLASSPAGSSTKPPLDHVIVIYLENRPFDQVFGLFPGAEGIAQAGPAATQVDRNGKPYEVLPPLRGATPNTTRPPTQLPDNLPNRPFDLQPFVPMDQTFNIAGAEAGNRFYQEQMAINGGKMDRFVSVSTSLTMGYYDGRSLAMWKLAEQYVLADHFFHATFGGTGPNHLWLFCACTATWPNAPADLVAQVATDGTLIKDGVVTPDGYLVNNWTPDQAKLIPRQSAPHIGDRLDAAGVSWAWYTAGWSAGQYASVFAPFAFFPTTASGTPGATRHLKDEEDFLAALKGPDLPAVAIVKPALNAHPIQGPGLVAGDRHTAELVKAIQDSAYWKSTAIIVAFDEAGGLWDHVAPPKVDRWGPGTRVPAIIVSPYAKKGFVDKTVYDTTSILRFIEWRWNLQPLGERDAKANNLLNAFDFSQKP